MSSINKPAPDVALRNHRREEGNQFANGMESVSIAWHPAFCSAAEFDLRLEKENLDFESEHNLSKEPLRMDLLIIKKNTDKVGDNEIAKLFRKYNVIEYKSPGDGLSGKVAPWGHVLWCQIVN